MSAEDDAALLGAVQSFVDSGHTFVIAPKAAFITKPPLVHASISGPSGSRSADAESVRQALESLVVQIVEARLSGAIPDPFAHLKACSQASVNPGVFDDLGPDSYF